MKTKLRLAVCSACYLPDSGSLSTAFAYAESDDDTVLTTPAPTPTQAPTQTPVTSSSSLTPTGNLTLVDDYNGTSKQFITVETRGGNYYYIVIDRSGSSEICTCSDKCVAGEANTASPVCKANMAKCKGRVKPTTTEQSDSSGNAHNYGAIKKLRCLSF